LCNAAGPCGYGIQRQLALMEHDRVVVAPSLIPRRPGERIKTVRRDAINLAKLHRAGGLTSAWVPDQAHEASAIWCGRVRPRCGRCRRPVSNCPASCCGMAITTTGRVDADAPAMACRSALRARGASYCAGRLHRGRRGCESTARPSGSPRRTGRSPRWCTRMRGMAYVAKADLQHRVSASGWVDDDTASDLSRRPYSCCRHISRQTCRCGRAADR
jgi:hypothetical protein